MSRNIALSCITGATETEWAQGCDGETECEGCDGFETCNILSLQGVNEHVQFSKQGLPSSSVSQSRLPLRLPISFIEHPRYPRTISVSVQKRLIRFGLGQSIGPELQNPDGTGGHSTAGTRSPTTEAIRKELRRCLYPILATNSISAATSFSAQICVVSTFEWPRIVLVWSRPGPH